ncbi:hypothetical protein CLH62_14560 [Marinobacter guineae]|uniref:Uncharacterized protein n=2 Tax=Marinobacter guineae TaxID=432303 RepID=A0A2G1VDN3_9GAMM|nr:hypothetical protein CLH62_14560 [Marinobacter guineae]
MKLPNRLYYSIPELAERWKCDISAVLECIVCGSLTPSVFLEDTPGWVISETAEINVDIVNESPEPLTGEVWFSPSKALLKGSQNVSAGLFFSESPDIPAHSRVILQSPIEASIETISIRNHPFIRLYEETFSGPELNRSNMINLAAATTERNTLYKIILGMAMAKYDYNPESRRNSATGENAGSISADLEEAGLSVDADTIREHLKAAYAATPPEKS